ncbi:non-hydrolyzing UDP-N-acetylglucosamine 2-epimerase [Roseateles toxinivorans]|nr:UDP-N-acetylglucosamine 2-epimerase (non-hydrolyzing) [Roseateles toxinivorans]
MTSARARKILFVFGTRPEAIKMAPVILRAKQEVGLEVKVCITGQHRQMLDQVMGLFQITADFDLDLMKTGQTLTSLTCDVLSACKDVMEVAKPDLVLVHGDTTTTMAASLAAFYARIPVAHIEAGLRTGDIYSPWPEELNRKLTGAIASLHFAPTEGARANLLREGVADRSIQVTGNTVVDALQIGAQRIAQTPTLAASLDEQLAFVDPNRQLILVTGHRRENFGEGFVGICQAIQVIAKRADVQIVYPVHLNPKVQQPVNQMLGGIPNVVLVPPMEYLPFLHLLGKAKLVLTDSGGIQEEAPALGKPVLVMRNTTERPEAIEAGTARLVGTDPAAIEAAVHLLLDDAQAYARMARAHNPFGDGHASERIVNRLMQS